MLRRRLSSAFTLVELLVVIAIIGVLVSLLLPAVNSAREAARRTQCMNQTRNVGLAILNHESAVGTFPGGGTVPWPEIEDYSSGGKPFGAEKQGLSWAYQILPYLEENSVHDLTTTQRIAETPIALYFCPSRRSPTFVPANILNAAYGAWLMDYASLQPIEIPEGASFTMDQLLNNDTACRLGYGFWGNGQQAPGGADFNPKTRQMLENENRYVGFKGIIVRSSHWVQGNGQVKKLGYDAITKVRKVKDGLSKTGMVGEKWVRIRDYANSYAAYDDRGWSDGWDLDTVSLAVCPPSADNNTNPGPGYASNATAGSAHAGGFNCVYGDAAVHFIKYGISPRVLNLIAHRADGQVFNENDE